MKQPSWQISRRTVLRGACAAIALPWLEAMTPLTAADPATAQTRPRRLAVLGFPNGIHPWTFYPMTTGRDWELTEQLMPLKDLKNDVLLFNQLVHPETVKRGGGHGWSWGAFLTGGPVKDPPTVSAVHVGGPSFDQFIAQRIGASTRIPSLALASSPISPLHNNEANTIYGAYMSWSNATTPAERLHDPLNIYHRLFGIGDDQVLRHELERNRGLIDHALGSARDLRRNLGTVDGRRLDEFMESLRTIERRIGSSLTPTAEEKPPPAPAGAQPPSRIPPTTAERDDLFMELIALAFQADCTRIATYHIAQDPYPGVGGLAALAGTIHHTVSHHEGKPEKIEKYNAVTTYCVGLYAKLLARLKSIPENGGTLLDQSMIMLGSPFGDGHGHYFRHAPVLIGGRGGGTIDPGRFVECPRDSRMCDLFLGLIQRMGVKADSFSDSTGPLPWLTADPTGMPREPQLDGGKGDRSKAIPRGNASAAKEPAAK